VKVVIGRRRCLLPATCIAVLVLASPAAASVPPTSPDSETTPVDTGPPPTLPPDNDVLTLQTPPPFSSQQVTSAPLIVIPDGCLAPRSALAVFEAVARAATATAVQFEVRQVRAGSMAGYADETPGSRVNVEYGVDARFVAVGERYVVGVGLNDAGTALESQVRRPAPMFGGDAVIGVNENDVPCPIVEDQVLTLTSDGRSVDSGVFTGMRTRPRSLLMSVLKPALIAFAILLGLVFAKHMLFGFGRSLRDMSTSPGMERSRSHSPPREPNLGPTEEQPAERRERTADDADDRQPA
jgi:hypothetical protein